jgi:ABC-type phosphate/phosphonate transport system substrate-binding protein
MHMQIRWVTVTLSILFVSALGGCDGSANTAKDGRWQSQMNHLRIGVRGDEADPSKTAGWGGFRQHIRDFTGLDPKTFEASDYNGTIQALSTGQVDYATMGGGSYANVDAQVGLKAAPFLTIIRCLWCDHPRRTARSPI